MEFEDLLELDCNEFNIHLPINLDHNMLGVLTTFVEFCLHQMTLVKLAYITKLYIFIPLNFFFSSSS